MIPFSFPQILKSFKNSPALRSALAVLIFSSLIPSMAHAVSSNVVISQVYGGGGNSGAAYKNDFIELFNRGSSAVDVTGWSVQYASGTGTSWSVTNLPSVTIQPGQYFLIQEAPGSGGTVNLPAPDVIDTIAMSSSSGKVALVNNATALSGACPSAGSPPRRVDLVGYGSANCYEGSGATPAPGNTTAAFRAAQGCTDTDNNSTDFTTATANPRNSATTTHACSVSTPTPPSGSGAVTPGTAPPGSTVLLTVVVTPGTNPISTGLTVTGDFTSIGGSATQAFYDDGTHGDATASDNIFSFQAMIGAGVIVGAKALPIQITDAQSRSATTTISLTVQSALTPIHDIQGNGTASPLIGSVVATRGIVTALKGNGFFLQAPDSQMDADPNTSEGIFVFTSGAPPAAAAVGNLVTVTGTVQEFIPPADLNSPSVTEIAGSPKVTLISTGNPLPAPITLTTSDTAPGGSIRQLRKYQSMRVHVDSLTVIGPTQGVVDEVNATSASNGIFYGVLTGLSRPFREAGIEVPNPMPAGAPCCIPRFDANPERLAVDSDGQTGATPLEVTAGATVTHITGPLDYSYRTDTILPDPATPPAVSGNIQAIAVPAPAANQFTVASSNLERFFDATDDPAITEPVLTAAAFNNRLNKASLAIRHVMMSPDILGIEEVENLSTLQALADKINNDVVAAGASNPNYQAYLVPGNDSGGINVGLLIKSSRVQVVEAMQIGKTETFLDPSTGAPATLNDRPPLFLRATLPQASGSAYPITVIVNHLRSLSGIDDPANPHTRAKRKAQAEFLANLVQARQTADPNEHLILTGDFNSYPFNDGFVDVLGTIKGTPAPADQVLLPSSDLVDPDLINLTQQAPVVQRYSFVYNGNAQALDHILISSNLQPRWSALHYARNNADFPESFRNDPTRPERLSDHDMPVAVFTLLWDTATTLSSSGNPSTFGDPVTVRANISAVAPGAGTPTGSVSFSLDGVAQPAVAVSSGVAQINFSSLSPGSHTLTASYSGDGNFNSSRAASPLLQSVLQKADLAIALNASPNPLMTGSSLAIRMAVSNAGPTDAGAVMMTSTLSSELSFVSMTAPIGWTCAFSDAAVTCTKATLTAGVSETLLLRAQAACDVIDGSSLSHTAILSFPGVDPIAANNSSSVSSTVFKPPVMLSPASAEFRSRGGTGHVSVNSLGNCPWTATSNSSFLTITSGRSGVGSSTVSYAVAQHSGSSSRSGTMTIAGQTFNVSQSALNLANAELNSNISAKGAAIGSTSGTAGPTQTGYSILTLNSSKESAETSSMSPDRALDGTAVFSLTQHDVVVSEAAVPASPPTTHVRVFIDYRADVAAKSNQVDAGVIQMNTGLALVNTGPTAANLTLTLRDASGGTLATGHGTLQAGGHRALFLTELDQLAPDFVLPAGFATAVQFATLDVSSSQPLSVVALRLAVNQRGETLMTTTPTADLTRSQNTDTVYFPQLADGGGYKTSIVLLNTSSVTETGTFKLYDDIGAPLSVHRVGDPPGTASSFRYSIPAGGFYTFFSAGATQQVITGSVQVVPDAGTFAPIGAGLFSYAPAGTLVSSETLVTESGIPSATPTTHALIYVDQSNGHNTGLAIAAIDHVPLQVTLKAYQADGVTLVGTGSVELTGSGHAARFANEFIPSLPANFTGVLDISAPTPFVALTLRGLFNRRGDFLLTTFPTVDFNQPAPTPLLFPQIADGGGYQTHFILLNTSGNSANVTLKFFGDDGQPLEVK